MASERIEFDSEDDEWMLTATDVIDDARPTTTTTTTTTTTFSNNQNDNAVMCGSGNNNATNDSWIHILPDPGASTSGISTQQNNKYNNNNKELENNTNTNSSSNIIDNDSSNNNNEDNVEQMYEVLSSTTCHNKQFKKDATEMKIQIKPIASDPRQHIQKIFDSILEKHLNDVPEDDMIGVTLGNQSFTKPVFVTFRKRSQLTTDIVLAEVEKIVQSNEHFMLKEPLEMKITRVEIPSGQKNRYNLSLLPFHEYCQTHKYSIIKIQNSDNLCLARAITAAIAYIRRANGEISNNQYILITRKNRTDIHQRAEAVKLCTDAEFDLDTFRGTLSDVEKFQEYFKDKYEISVFDGIDYTGKRLLFKGRTSNEAYIDLFFGNNHYNAITSVTGAFECAYYCRQCHRGFSNKNKHIRCAGKCKTCNHQNQCIPEDGYKRQCEGCKRLFTSEECYNRHKQPTLDNNKSMCDVTKYCLDCQETYTLFEHKHQCGYMICHNCDKYVERSHLCYVQPLKQVIQNGDKHQDLFVFYDFESRVDNATGMHIPNYCVMQHQCTSCLHQLEGIENECIRCGKREYIFEGDGDVLVEKLFETICEKSVLFRKVYVFAHNGGGYDHHFIAKYMIMKRKWEPTIIKNGSKIVMLTYKNICLKDTLCYFGRKLAALPEMFDIPEEAKGYFPHFFNKPENYSYIGPVPDIKEYGADEMSPQDHKAFVEWHNLQRKNNVVFNFREEMKKYCKSDVDILRKASLKFRKLFQDLLRVDPLTSAVTIASACMKGYRTNFLLEDTIGLMTFKTYSMRDRQSNLALRYIVYLENKYGIQLQSAYRGREKEFGRYKVDAFYEKFPTSKLEEFDSSADSRTEIPLIIEVHGCFFHGCHFCHSEEELNKPIGKQYKSPETLEQRYQNTLKKMEYLRKLPCKPHVIEIWECEIRQQCTIDDVLRKYMSDEQSLIRIQSNREAFFGGRTECFRKYYKIQPGEQIRYIDVNSLYPYINKYGVYPIGHPEILLGDDALNCDFANTTGIAKVKILPPEQLFFPILPIKADNKLTFALCHTCALTANEDSCEHTEDQRACVGTYTCVEISEAIKNGYTVKDVYEVWSYASTQYDKQTRTGGIFTEYIDTFLKIKQAASGYPSSVKSDQDKLEFCQKFTEKEGVDLQPHEVEYNPGMRSLSKLCLNSLWGKFGQRNRLLQTSIIGSYHELFDILNDPEKEVIDCYTLVDGENDDDDVDGEDDQQQQQQKSIELVSWRTIDEISVDEDFVNPVISAYVTAQARLYLFQFLKQLGERVLYCDTDSIIYVQKPQDAEIETGSYLGEMGNEMDGYTKKFGPGCFISEFICEGPKNYSYQVVDVNGVPVKKEAKVRGFTLDYVTCALINLDTMRQFVTSGQSAPIIETKYPHKIQRKRPFDIITKEMPKVYKHIRSKRRLIDSYKTIPYGWVDDNDDNDSSDDSE